MNQNTNNKPMSDLLDALAEECCKLEWKEYHVSTDTGRYVARFDRSRAEALISAYCDAKVDEVYAKLNEINNGPNIT